MVPIVRIQCFFLGLFSTLQKPGIEPLTSNQRMIALHTRPSTLAVERTSIEGNINYMTQTHLSTLTQLVNYGFVKKSQKLTKLIGFWHPSNAKSPIAEMLFVSLPPPRR